MQYLPYLHDLPSSPTFIWIVLIPHSQAWDEDNNVSKAPVTLTLDLRQHLILQGNLKTRLTPFFNEELVAKYKNCLRVGETHHMGLKNYEYVPKIKVLTNKSRTMKFNTHKKWIHQYCKLYNTYWKVVSKLKSESIWPTCGMNHIYVMDHNSSCIVIAAKTPCLKWQIDLL